MAKDPFKKLDTDFKDTAANMDEAQLRSKISQVTLNQEALMAAKEDDGDLASCREQYSTAGAIYREGTKMNKLRVKYLRHMLGVKNKDTGSF